jgi:hypothetical protein
MTGLRLPTATDLHVHGRSELDSVPTLRETQSDSPFRGTPTSIPSEFPCVEDNERAEGAE